MPINDDTFIPLTQEEIDALPGETRGTTALPIAPPPAQPLLMEQACKRSTISQLEVHCVRHWQSWVGLLAGLASGASSSHASAHGIRSNASALLPACLADPADLKTPTDGEEVQPPSTVVDVIVPTGTVPATSAPSGSAAPQASPSPVLAPNADDDASTPSSAPAPKPSVAPAPAPAAPPPAPAPKSSAAAVRVSNCSHAGAAGWAGVAAVALGCIALGSPGGLRLLHLDVAGVSALCCRLPLWSLPPCLLALSCWRDPATNHKRQPQSRTSCLFLHDIPSTCKASPTRFLG